jgi:protocatechuate 3,4-dioxygenase, alpha subunit
MNEVRLSPSASQTVGPFYGFALTKDLTLGCLCLPGFEGERIRVRLRLTDGDGAPVPDSMVEIWQADAEGRYAHPEDPQQKAADPAFCGFGRLPTDMNGACVFQTVKPGSTGQQGSHINVSIFARGLLTHLITRIYFAGDPLLETDPVLGVVPEDRRHTMIAQRDANDPAQWNLDIHLQGKDETVFFAV